MSDTPFGRWRRRFLVLTLFGLIAVGVVPALVGLWVTPGVAARVPDDPEAFVARFGEPDAVDAAEPAGPQAPSATRSLVYRRARVRAVFALGARGGKWSGGPSFGGPPGGPAGLVTLVDSNGGLPRSARSSPSPRIAGEEFSEPVVGALSP